ncbi:DUF6844 domain-containing protein [Desulforhopalus sp. 52FAK]
MTYVLHTLAIFTLLMISSPVLAQDNSSATAAPPATDEQEVTLVAKDAEELNTISDPKSVPLASDSMDDWFDTVFQRFNIQEGENNGKFILTASQSVMLKPTDPQYGNAYMNAFDKAMITLQNEYVKIRFGSTVVDKVQSFYADNSTLRKEIELPSVSDPSYIEKVLLIMQKGLEVTDKQLDKQLIELGVSPSTLSQLTPVRKKDLFRDKFIQNTITKASGSIAGLFPIQTNVITDSNGDTVVGVVAIASDKTIQIAKDISLQRESIITGAGRDIQSLLPETDEEFLATLGVRLAYDKDGTPAIISYGISSYMPNSSDSYINNTLKAEAKNGAVAKGNAQIAEIVNGRMNTNESIKTGEEIRTYVEREMKPDSDTIEKTIKNVINITNRNIRSSAKVKLQGISTVKTWRHTSEDGHRYYGAVRVWKYSTLEAVNAFNNPRKAAAKSQKYDQSQQESKPVNTMDDF